MYTLNCRGKLLVIEQPLVMGILNLTPDSFYRQRLDSADGAIPGLVHEMITEGADIIDIGGQSTRPGSKRISAAEETERVVTVIESIRAQLPSALLSIDTYYHEVALAAVRAGASIVNDISGGQMDPNMLAVVGGLNVPFICMHMKGQPETMQTLAHYTDLIKELVDCFIERLDACKRAGIHDVVIDPGFGFAKTITHNLQLLQQLQVFGIFERPILAGLSRKSTVYKTLGTTPEEALNGTTVLNTIALLNGASILRVHDVRAAREAIKLVERYKQA